MVSHPKRDKNLRDCSLDQLRDEARQLNISGYATMEKTELVEEIQRRRDEF